MAALLQLARLAAAVNAVLLLALCSVWLRNYRRHGASHTLGFLAVGGFLLLQNAVWLWLYLASPGYVDWFLATSTPIRAAVTLVCVLETVALVVLARLTWR